jgi:hypothetical protein
MEQFELTADDREILIEANNLYLFDWREEDANEKTAGWRYPSYFPKSYNFSKLVDAGLMKKGDVSPFKPAPYRISELGMRKVAELSSPPPVATERDALVRGDLFTRVQEVLDGCNPAVANEFRNYGNLAEKQIQERDIALAALEKQNAELKDAVGFWHNAWRELRQTLIKERRAE